LLPVATPAAVFFDVDFTLIYPGPRFQGAGYEANCARHGIAVDLTRFDAAVAGAACVLDLETAGQIYDPQVFLNYTRRIIELMGGSGPAVDAVSREMYDDWALHHHFSLYDDVADALRALRALGVRLGLITNTHRCLASFQSHFDLDRLIAVAVSSSDHGFMKPHPSIFRAALERMGVAAGDAVMVGDSLPHDVIGARAAGLGSVLLARGSRPVDAGPDVPVIRTLAELPALVANMGAPRGAGRAR
jgi:HAD superfamily hydrolase (TIGR01509 family)